ncbi:thioredoxin family protein [Skermania sp. ID1734]|uniref:thioredoxin family protein n=1 Tax=Skermania sp. ID1734 TaxID=2597516 RepID=UPI0011814AFA|nr:thioredoxin family protein [Skermania sp. ID1734]TSD96558.1 thioredoxin family protein [Skermania sp. ID1734]
MIQIIILVVVLLVACGAGLWLRARAGQVRQVAADAPADERVALLAAAGVGEREPTVLHFSADWCGPCAAVRRVVGQVIGELAQHPRPPREVELDIDENPSLARELGVLSLPTTFIFDGADSQLFRISGVPSAADLRNALQPLSG